MLLEYRPMRIELELDGWKSCRLCQKSYIKFHIRLDKKVTKLKRVRKVKRKSWTKMCTDENAGLRANTDFQVGKLTRFFMRFL